MYLIETTSLRLPLWQFYCSCVIEATSLTYFGCQIKATSSNLPVLIVASLLRYPHEWFDAATLRQSKQGFYLIESTPFRLPHLATYAGLMR